MENDAPLSPSLNDATSALLAKTCNDPEVGHRGGHENSNHVSKPPVSFEEKRKRHRLWMLIALLFVVCLVLFILVLTFALSKNGNVCMEKRCIRTAATLINAINWTAEPCEDFYRYACGGWEEKHHISSSEAAVTNFNILMKNMESLMNDLLSAAPKPGDAKSIITAKKFFKQCLAEEDIKKNWKKAMDKEICECSSQGWPARGLCGKDGKMGKPWMENKSEPHGKVQGCFVRRYSTYTFLKLAVNPDDKNSSMHTLVIDQPSLPLHSTLYKRNSKVMKAYKDLVTGVFEMLAKLDTDFEGYLDRATKDANDVIDLEYDIAQILEPDNGRLEPLKMYRLSNLGMLTREFPEVNFTEILNALFPDHEFNDQSPMVVNCWPYLQRWNATKIGARGSRIIYNYMYWRWFYDAMLQDLSGEFATLFDTFDTVKSGAMQQKARWRRCVQILIPSMDKVVGAMYVREHFTEKTEKRANEMVINIMKSFNKILAKQRWLTKETHDLAMEKANKINADISYPKYLKDNDKLDAEYKDHAIQDNYFGSKFLFQKLAAGVQLDQLYTPVDKDKWITGPATVNAYYSPNHNSIVIPAGILQPVFYSPDYPTSMNYGGIGVVIGHELTHGFDDKGRMYDKDGNLKEWWDKETSEHFNKRAKCVEEQYGRYKLEQIDQYIDGNVTKGENIADNGGLKEAYYAFKQWEAENGAEDRLPGLESLSHDQLFFLNYAQIWCGKFNDQEAKIKIRMIHSPGPIRVLGPLSNSVEFSKAFGCTGKNPADQRWRMNPEEKCSVW